MKFYDREQEISTLKGLKSEAARMVVLTGRRRIGKTALALEFVRSKNHSQNYLYLYVGRKSEALLCEEYIAAIREIFDYPIIGHITQFSQVFALLLEISKAQPFTLIIDEFQEFLQINPVVFSEIQKLWDLNKDKSQLLVIFIGSIYSLMYKIFEDKKEPLFGRADRILNIKPFPINTMRTILKDYAIEKVQTLFDFYVTTGGVPKYVDLLLTNKVKDRSGIINFMLEENSPFLHEGRNVLIQEFGKDYGVYFSILELITLGKTSRPEIESILEKNVGGYLDRLESHYSVIEKIKSIHSKPQTKSQKYKIRDLFLNFWFRFIFSNDSAIEIGNFDYVKQIIRRDYSSYSGRIFEYFIKELLASTGQFNQIGSYWESGFRNEIDVVAVNDLERRVLIAELKLNKKKINLSALKAKAKNLVTHYAGYSVDYAAIGFEDVKNYLE